jgi:mannose/cellobiose epimerase-like protein (N-acyl-D-glucosamine 2-epimerase family)
LLLLPHLVKKLQVLTLKHLEEARKMARKKAKSGGKICEAGKAWARRTFDTYPSAYANLAASKYCKDPNYAKASKKRKKKK